MDVIVTVPHGLCPHHRFRTCDTRASEVATALFEALLQRLPPEVLVHIFRANQAREVGDLNRPSTRHLEWRREIQNTVEHSIALGRRVLLFDVHSFPDECESFCKALATHEIPQVVLLDEPGAPHHALANEVTRAADLLRFGLLQASNINDISVQARAAGAEAMLWEFNESKHALDVAAAARVISVLTDYAVAKLHGFHRTAQ
jgi:hypothetical protein